MKVYQTNEIKTLHFLAMMAQVKPPSQSLCSLRVVL